jgi:hypothetical protein
MFDFEEPEFGEGFGEGMELKAWNPDGNQRPEGWIRKGDLGKDCEGPSVGDVDWLFRIDPEDRVGLSGERKLLGRESEVAQMRSDVIMKRRYKIVKLEPNSKECEEAERRALVAACYLEGVSDDPLCMREALASALTYIWCLLARYPLKDLVGNVPSFSESLAILTDPPFSWTEERFRKEGLPWFDVF